MNGSVINQLGVAGASADERSRRWRRCESHGADAVGGGAVASSRDWPSALAAPPRMSGWPLPTSRECDDVTSAVVSGVAFDAGDGWAAFREAVSLPRPRRREIALFLGDVRFGRDLQGRARLSAWMASVRCFSCQARFLRSVALPREVRCPATCDTGASAFLKSGQLSVLVCERTLFACRVICLTLVRATMSAGDIGEELQRDCANDWRPAWRLGEVWRCSE